MLETKKEEQKKYYYEFGIFPTDDIEDAYSLYFELDFELNTGNIVTSCNLMIEKGYLGESDAIDCQYIKESSKEDYDWSKK